jgi:hypothetical protein
MVRRRVLPSVIISEPTLTRGRCIFVEIEQIPVDTVRSDGEETPKE